MSEEKTQRNAEEPEKDDLGSTTPSTSVWLVHMEGAGQQSERARARRFRRPKTRHVRIGKEAQLFDYEGKEHGAVYGGFVPMLMGFMLPMTIVMTLFLVLALGFGVNIAMRGINGDEQVMEFFGDLLEESTDADGNFDFQDYMESLSGNLDNLPTELYITLACVYLATFAVGFVCIPICLRQMENRRKFITLGMRGTRRVGKFFFGWLIGAAAVVVPFLVSAALAGIPIRLNPEIGLNGRWLLPNVFGLLFFCVQGSFEELIFRGWSFTTLGKRHGRMLSIVLSSVVFASLHYSLTPESLLSVLNAFLLGCLFCLMTLKTGDIFFACGFHAMWNYLQFTLSSGFSDAGGWLERSEALSEMANGTLAFVVLECCVVAALVIAALLYRRRVQRDGGMAYQPLPRALRV